MINPFKKTLIYSFLLSVSIFAQTWKIIPTNNFPEQSISFMKAVAIDIDLQGNLYIVDEGNHQILKFNEDGELLKKIGGFGFGAAQFDSPKDIFANSNLMFLWQTIIITVWYGWIKI